MRLPSLLAVLACLVAAGCSMQSSKDKYVEAYGPLNDQVVAVNQELVETLNTPSSPGRLASELAPLSGKLTKLSRQVSDLDTPEDLREESAALSRALASTGEGASRTAGFARDADRAQLVAATKRLADEVNALSRRTRRLAEAVG